MGAARPSLPRLTELLSELHATGVSLVVQDGKLRVNAPAGAVTPALRDELAAHKAELLDLLSATPLAPAQERLWVLYQLEPESCRYHVPLYLTLGGPLDVEALRKSLELIIARHEPLRTRFIVRDGADVQDVQAPCALDLPVTDWVDRSPEQIQRELTEAARLPFRLAEENPLRIQLYRTAEQEHVLLLCAHHLAIDGWSVALLSRELAIAYTGFLSGTKPELPALPLRYSAYAARERALRNQLRNEQQVDFWKQQLDGATPLALPLDQPRPGRLTGAGARIPITLPADLVANLQTLSLRHQATLFMTLLAGLHTLLYRYTGQADICVGTPVANRPSRDTQELIGFFANTLVLRTDSSSVSIFSELLAQVRERNLAAQENQDVPFEDVLQHTHGLRSLGEMPLVSVLFALQNSPVSAGAVSNLTANFRELDLGTAKFPLSLSLETVQGELRGYLEYSTELFLPATAERLVRHFLQVLEGAVDNPAVRLATLPLLSPAERHQIVDEWNKTAQPYPSLTVDRLFELQAARTPDDPALRFGEHSLTYQELNTRANRLARYLLSQRLPAGSPVGLCLPRCPELIVAMLGVLKAGGVYVPLDPEYPAERLAFLIADAGLPVVLTSSAVVPPAAGNGARWLSIDREAVAILQQDAANLPPEGRWPSSDDLAYILYTSGSTGRPKGVEIPHRGIVRLLFGQTYAHFGPDEVMLQLAPASFDAATFEIWAPLLHGGCCALAPPGLPSFAELGALLERHRVTTLWLTATLFHAIIEQAPQILAPVRQLLAGGEALSPAHVRRALTLLPNTRLINGYGPTENTTFTCCYTIPREFPADAATVPIGTPIANTQVYVLDANQEVVPIGVAGELYIGGSGLARAYHHEPALTAEKFLADPFHPGDPNARLYRSGDRVRYRPDGVLEYLGRLDEQIKLRGHRIEPGEIESVLLSLGAQAAAALVLQPASSSGTEQLVAFYVPGPGMSLAGDDLHAAFKQKLPAYLLPNRFVPLDKMPVLDSGKLDRAALKSRPLASDEPARLPRQYRSPLEARLAGIMAEVLEVDRVEASDDFFALGGHSLLAMRLIVRLEETYGTRLPAAVLFQNSTPAALAQVLEAGQAGPLAASCCLVPLQPGGPNPPLFFLHTMDGDLLLYRPLILGLGPEQPVYGVQVSPLENQLSGMTSVEELAAHYLTEIRRVQPRGPYRLCGYSFGGILAFEVARQLEAQGDEVGLLAILDTTTYMLRIDWTRSERWTQFRRWLRYRTRVLSEGGLPTVAEYVSHKVKHKMSGGEPLVMGWVAPDRRALAASLLQLLDNYCPRPYAGRAVLFRAAERDNSIDFDPTNGWYKLVLGGIDIESTPGDHLTFIKEPNAAALAARLNQCLALPPRPHAAVTSRIA